MNRAPKLEQADPLPYLAIPEPYFAWLGGLRWSEDAEAIEYRHDRAGESRTFAMLGEVALFLEGFATSGSVLCFGHALHFLDILGAGRRTEVADDEPSGRQPGVLRRLFRESGRPFRNAGALAARVGVEIPRAGRPVDIGELCRRLQADRSRSHQIGQVLALAFPEVPPLSPLIFSARVLKNLAAMKPDEIRHWLKSGRAPTAGGKELAERADADRPLSEILDTVEKRPRMAASSALAGRILGALTIPPRRLASVELPIGGYADVSTRGHPEQLLMSQFALEPTELLRRFAERELLFFRREEPRTPTSEEMLIVIDQGVRTWGGVRSVLGAAALAMGRIADRRGIRFRAITTGEPREIVDPLVLGERAFGERLESSDLSPNPAAPLEYLAEALRSLPAMPRDVILLSHTRGLREPDVLAASAGLPTGTRLFGVSVDDRGEVGLSELRQGGIVPISRCRVPMPAEPEPEAPPIPAGTERPWSGDVESIPFPFRLGIARKPLEPRFDLDPSGQWLFVGGYAGEVHAWRVDDGEGEILPRGVLGKRPVSDLVGLIGVSDGVLTLGRVDGQLIAVHYDLATRRVRVHPVEFKRDDDPISLGYMPDCHCVLIGWPGAPLRGLDLGQEPAGRAAVLRESNANRPAPTPRCRLALGIAERLRLTFGPNRIDPREIPPEFPDNRGDDDWCAIVGSGLVGCPLASLNSLDGSASLDLDGRSETWRPLSDGKPLLAGCRMGRAAAAGPVAAISATHPGALAPEDRQRLFLFDRQAGRLLRVIPGMHDPSAFAISRDGRRVAFATSNRRIAVQDVEGQGEDRFITPMARVHSRIRVLFGLDHLAVSISGASPDSFFEHPHRVIRWDSGILEWDRDIRSGRRFSEGPRMQLDEYTRGSSPWPDRRYVAGGVARRVLVLVDYLGQIIVRDEAHKLVAIFFVFRDDLAAWLPDGTRMGPPGLIGGPPTPDAARKIGLAMQAACGLNPYRDRSS